MLANGEQLRPAQSAVVRPVHARGLLVAAAVALVMLGGCATSGGEPGDPLEGFNRSMFAFNDKF
ncbi:MAG TPA: VacJ family lipoprotein, partial [Burkholderiales bacterium]|nr:VacJ family lipoprotein [Burkholderiales bacterium]